MSQSAFNKIAAGMKDAIAYAEGADASAYGVHIPETVDIKKIRKRLNMSQPAFAQRFGFSLGRLRDWEQSRSPIDPSSRILLTIIDKEPEAVQRALSAA